MAATLLFQCLVSPASQILFLINHQAAPALSSEGLPGDRGPGVIQLFSLSSVNLCCVGMWRFDFPALLLSHWQELLNPAPMGGVAVSEGIFRPLGPLKHPAWALIKQCWFTLQMSTDLAMRYHKISLSLSFLICKIECLYLCSAFWDYTGWYVWNSESLPCSFGLKCFIMFTTVFLFCTISPSLSSYLNWSFTEASVVLGFSLSWCCHVFNIVSAIFCDKFVSNLLYLHHVWSPNGYNNRQHRAGTSDVLVRYWVI